MNYVFVLIYICFYTPLLKAEDWSSVYEARSHEQLMSSDKKISRLKSGLAYCLAERELGSFPISCFDYLNGQLKKPLSSSVFSRQQKQLNQLCVMRSEKLLSLAMAQRMLKIQIIDEKCRKKIESRIEDLEYIQERRSRAGLDIEITRDHEQANSGKIPL